MSKYVVYKNGKFSNTPRFERNIDDDEKPDMTARKQFNYCTGYRTFKNGKFIVHHCGENHIHK